MGLLMAMNRAGGKAILAAKRPSAGAIRCFERCPVASANSHVVAGIGE